MKTREILLQGRRGEPTLESWLLASTCALDHIHVHAYTTHTHTSHIIIYKTEASFFLRTLVIRDVGENKVML